MCANAVDKSSEFHIFISLAAGMWQFNIPRNHPLVRCMYSYRVPVSDRYLPGRSIESQTGREANQATGTRSKYISSRAILPAFCHSRVRVPSCLLIVTRSCSTAITQNFPFFVRRGKPHVKLFLAYLLASRIV